MKLTPYEYKKHYIPNAEKLYDSLGGHCQNCGEYIGDPINWNFAHTESANGATKIQRLYRFVFICRVLHDWETNKPGNAGRSACVQIFRRLHLASPGEGFWEPFIIYYDLFKEYPILGKKKGLKEVKFYE